ncbi:MAG: helix-turn-helix transcriptional regulator [Chloroflexi bacterium]|nr:helix-turn-helix transcriptional regulator [Chloroflexota bacterium]
MSPVFPLLGLLLRGDAYGYELKRIVETEFEPHWRIDFAQLYRSLAKLSADGLARAHVAASAGGPERRIYHVTARGRSAFEKWIHAPAAAPDEFWVKARLATTLGYAADALIAGERARVNAARAVQRELQRQARADADAGQLVMREAALRRAQADADALDLAAAVMRVSSHRAAPAQNMPLMLVGSDDPLLGHLAQTAHLLSQVVGSTAGLEALAANQADVAATHLRDPEAHEYNVPFVQLLIPEEDILLVNLAVREYGLLVARGNPKKIRGVRDLARRDVRMLNRTRGAGARVWLLQHLRAARLNPTTLRGWSDAVATYDAVAGAISSGAADVGPGLRTTAVQWDLDFIGLGEERFDLAIPRSVYESPRGVKLFQWLDDQTFRAYAAALPGYDLARSGRVMAEIKYGRATSRKIAR